jgi:hypothetical protein
LAALPLAVGGIVILFFMGSSICCCTSDDDAPVVKVDFEAEKTENEKNQAQWQREP